MNSLNSVGRAARIGIDARIISSSTGTYVHRLLEHLQDVDSENDYVVFVKSKDLDYWVPRAQNFMIVAADFDNYSLAEQFAYRRLLQSMNLDLVHFCMPQQPLLYVGRRVTTIHDLTLLKTVNRDKNLLVYRFKQLVGKLAFKVAARKSEVVICPTEFTRREIANRWPDVKERLLVTYEAAEVEEPAIERVDLPFEKYILYVGSHSGYKNTRRLVEAHQILRASHPELGLVFAGSVDSAARIVQEFVRDSGAKSVHFTGRVSVAQRNFLYKSADAYVFPSLMEGFGLPGLEAMLWATPVISSRETCLPEVYGDAAEYFDPFDTVAIAAAIDAVVSNPKRVAELTEAGHRRVMDFSWRRMAEQTHGAYMTALSEAPR